MIALSDSGWTVARIALRLKYSIETVRRLLRRFPNEGFRVVRHEAPGPAKDEARRKQVAGALERLLREPRTWTSGQLADALGKEGIVLRACESMGWLTRCGSYGVLARARLASAR